MPIVFIKVFSPWIYRFWRRTRSNHIENLGADFVLIKCRASTKEKKVPCKEFFKPYTTKTSRKT